MFKAFRKVYPDEFQRKVLFGKGIRANRRGFLEGIRTESRVEGTEPLAFRCDCRKGQTRVVTYLKVSQKFTDTSGNRRVVVKSKKKNKAETPASISVSVQYSNAGDYDESDDSRQEQFLIEIKKKQIKRIVTKVFDGLIAQQDTSWITDFKLLFAVDILILNDDGSSVSTAVSGFLSQLGQIDLEGKLSRSRLGEERLPNKIELQNGFTATDLAVFWDAGKAKSLVVADPDYQEESTADNLLTIVIDPQTKRLVDYSTLRVGRPFDTKTEFPRIIAAISKMA